MAMTTSANSWITAVNADMQRYTTRPIFSIAPPERRRVASLKGTVIGMEGLICATKTSLGKSIASHCNSCGVEGVFLEEKVNSALHSHFYRDMEKDMHPNPWAFPFQMDMLRRCQKSYSDALWLSGKKGGGPSRVVIADRTVFGNSVFAAMHHESRNINDEQYAVYTNALEEEGHFAPDYVLYLDVDPTIALHRVQHMRVGNSGEKKIPLSYLQELERAYFLHIYHQLASKQSNIIIINTDSFYSAEKVIDIIAHHDGSLFDVRGYDAINVAKDPKRIRAFFTEAADWYLNRTSSV